MRAVYMGVQLFFYRIASLTSIMRMLDLQCFYFGNLELSLRNSNERAKEQGKTCQNTTLGNQPQLKEPSPQADKSRK